MTALERGQSLYGLGEGCSAWHATPPDDPVEDATRGAPPHGRLVADSADAQGRLFSFSYAMKRKGDGMHMWIAGRGSYSLAPGVSVVDDNGDALIGVGSYCALEVEVHAHPTSQDAVLVGNESWYLSRDACEHSASAQLAVRECSDMKKRNAR